MALSIRNHNFIRFDDGFLLNGMVYIYEYVLVLDVVMNFSMITSLTRLASQYIYIRLPSTQRTSKTHINAVKSQLGSIPDIYQLLLYSPHKVSPSYLDCSSVCVLTSAQIS